MFAAISAGRISAMVGIELVELVELVVVGQNGSNGENVRGWWAVAVASSTHPSHA